MISKKYLLFLAGIVWSVAGYNVLHIWLTGLYGIFITCAVLRFCSGISVLPVYDIRKTGEKTYKTYQRLSGRKKVVLEFL